jgi:hypothetical protein
MRRIAAVIALLAAAMVVVPPPASAGGLTRVVSRAGHPSPFDVLRMDCPLDGFSVVNETTAYSHVFGAGFPPSGTGSLRIMPAADKLPGLGMMVDQGTLADVTTLSVSVYNRDSARLISLIRLTADTSGDSWELQAHEVKSSPGYITYSPLDMSYTWYNLTTGMVDGSGTIDQFLAANPQQTDGYIFAMMSGDCAHISSRPVFFDHVDYVAAGNGARYDFESTTGGLSIAANHSTVVSGGRVQLSTVLKDGGVPRAGATVTLWARPNGAAHFVKIRTVHPTNPNGAAFATVRPTKTTTYQWRHAKDAHVQATHSPNKIVQVTH